MNLYVSDLDGTLLDYSGKLKSRAERVLNRFIDKGVLFSYATARRFWTADKLMGGVKTNIPLITMNGVILVDSKTGKRASIELLPPNSAETARKFIKTNNETPFIYCLYNGKESTFYLKDSNSAIKKHIALRKDDPARVECANYDELFKGEIYFITLLNPESSLEDLNAVFRGNNGLTSVNYVDTYDKNVIFYETWNMNVSKATAALKLKELTKADKLICFGDNTNDIAMFKVADECYAVENACEELKALATGIIPSNNDFGVPRFIEERETKKFYYVPPEAVIIKPDQARFTEAINAAPNSETSQSAAIGTLNEKAVHNALKNYFSDENSREAKIGAFYADAVNENGITEIQTANWDKLNKKLAVFLEACHVTVVYPFEKKVNKFYIDAKTGELLKKSKVINKSLTDFMLELYRVRGFLTDKNLAVCLAEIEINDTKTVKDPAKPNSKKNYLSRTKEPITLIRELYFNKAEDYLNLIPPEALEKLRALEAFTKKDFAKVVKNCDASIMLEVLGYVGAVKKVGKKGREFVYGVRD